MTIKINTSQPELTDAAQEMWDSNMPLQLLQALAMISMCVILVRLNLMSTLYIRIEKAAHLLATLLPLQAMQNGELEKARKENEQLRQKIDKASKEKDHALLIAQRKGKELEKEVKKLKAKYEAEDDEHIAESQHSAYDAVALFTSLSSFAQSKEFDILRSVHSHFDINAAQPLRIVAVVGLFDKGKTFLINTLFGTSLASGKLFSTQGLSFLYIPFRKMLVVDTAGIQATVSYEQENIEPIVDAQTTETFCFELISRLADMVIFVVNDFTWVEQKHVDMFHAKDKMLNKTRELLVVHNLRTTTTETEAEQLFEKQIVSRYRGATCHLAELVYHADLSPNIHHVVFCKDRSPAGDKYNNANKKYIMDKLEHAGGGHKTVVPIELLNKHVEDLLPKFLLHTLPEAETLKMVYQVASDGSTAGNADTNNSNYVKSGSGDNVDYVKSVCKVAQDCSFRVKATGVINEWGELDTFNASFKPEANIYTVQEGRRTTLTIQMEVPGVTTFEVEMVSTGVLVVVKKPITIFESRVTPVTPIIERHGTFENIFRIEDRLFDLDKDKCSLVAGILRIVLTKDDKQPRRHELSSVPEATILHEGMPYSDLSAVSDVQGSDIIDWRHRSVSEVGGPNPEPEQDAPASPVRSFSLANFSQVEDNFLPGSPMTTVSGGGFIRIDSVAGDSEAGAAALPSNAVPALPEAHVPRDLNDNYSEVLSSVMNQESATGSDDTAFPLGGMALWGLQNTDAQSSVA